MRRAIKQSKAEDRMRGKRPFGRESRFQVISITIAALSAVFAIYEHETRLTTEERIELRRKQNEKRAELRSKQNQAFMTLMGFISKFAQTEDRGEAEELNKNIQILIHGEIRALADTGIKTFLDKLTSMIQEWETTRPPSDFTSPHQYQHLNPENSAVTTFVMLSDELADVLQSFFGVNDLESEASASNEPVDH